MKKTFFKISILFIFLAFIIPVFSYADEANFNDLTIGTYTAVIEDYPSPGKSETVKVELIADYNGRIYIDEQKSVIPYKNTYDTLLPRELTYVGPNGSSITFDLMSNKRVGAPITGEIKSDGKGNIQTPTITSTKPVTPERPMICNWSKGEDAGKYCLLAPLGNLLGGSEGKINIREDGMAKYLDGMFKAGVAIATGLTLVMIVIGGLQYVSTDAWGGKSEGRQKITQALLGLILALGTVLIVGEINPTLLRSDMDLNQNISLTRISGPDVSSLGLGLTTTSGWQARLNNPTEPAYRVGTFDTGPLVYSNSTDGWKTGKATNFGYKDSMDNGMGSPILNPKLEYGDVKQKDGSYKKEPLGIITNDSFVQGVALPKKVLESYFNITVDTRANWDPVRKAGVMVKNSQGVQAVVPIVDFGPGAGPLANGVIIDETYALNKKMGGDGQRSYKIIPNYYPNR